MGQLTAGGAGIGNEGVKRVFPLGMMPMCKPSGSSAGTSFMLCTAISTSLASKASSISLTNSPLPPTLARGTSVILSPLVMIFTSSTEVSGYWASIKPLIQLD